MTPSKPKQHFITLFWGSALIGLCLWAIWNIGGFDLTTTLSDGTVVPNTYGTVDHPFHASRASVLLETIGQGELLRWMGSHQGGYPVEFYPLGVAWIDVVLYVLTLGTIPILALHKLAVALIFVLPALAYWLLVRGDKLHPSAAFLATAVHVAFPGHWLNGGYEELVGWGLVTNVAGGTFALMGTVLLARYVLYRHHYAGVGAVIAIAAGAVSNPRSLFAVVLAALAIAVCHLIRSRELAFVARVRDAVIAIGCIGVLALLLSAPVITALMRYSDQYLFLHYQFYRPLSMYWDALITAMSLPVLVVSIVCGAIVSAVWRQPRATFALAVTVLFYALFTMWVAGADNPPPLVEQLEAPRLMPFQRLAMIALAAVLTVSGIVWLTQRLTVAWREAIIAVVVIGGSAIGINLQSTGSPNELVNEQAMYPVSTVGVQRFADLEAATSLANDIRPQGTAVLVIGNQDNWWHEQLWAPGIENGTYYYDDWMWYWHDDQPGPYRPVIGYWMQNPSDALNDEYFQQHGIGVVMVSDMGVSRGTPPRISARSNPRLEHAGTFGGWDVYTVATPTSIASREGEPAETAEVGNGRITASFPDGTGDIVVRQNWFPRWEATVNGQPARMVRDTSGYMRIMAPDGPVELELRYGVTIMDWLARVGSLGGVVGLAAFAWRGQSIRVERKQDNV